MFTNFSGVGVLASALSTGEDSGFGGSGGGRDEALICESKDDEDGLSFIQVSKALRSYCSR